MSTPRVAEKALYGGNAEPVEDVVIVDDPVPLGPPAFDDLGALA